MMIMIMMMIMMMMQVHLPAGNHNNRTDADRTHIKDWSPLKDQEPRH